MSIPVFLAIHAPSFFLLITVILESFFAYSSQIAKLLSFEPSLTKINSISFKLWLSILSMDFAKYFSALYTGTTKLTFISTIISPS